MDGGIEDRPRRSVALACAAATAAAVVAIAICFMLAEVVSRPLGVVAGFAIGGFVLASRAELAAGIAGQRSDGLPALWLGLLGLLVAAGAPLLAVAT